MRSRPHSLALIALCAACGAAPAWRSESMAGGGDLHSVWASGESDVWAVGPTAGVLHWDGTRWAMPGAVMPPGLALSGVWGASANDVWFAGATGTLLHWDGSSFSLVNSPTDEWLCAVAGASATDAWAVGGLSVVHWDGTHWTSVFAPVDYGSLLSVWESPGGEVWATGTQGTLVHKPAGTTAFVRVDTDSDADLLGVWGSGDNDVWFVGNHGTLLHWDGHALTSTEAPGGAGLASVWGRASDDVWAVGAVILHWDGARWTQQEAPADLLSGVGGTSQTPRAVGPAGTLLRYGN